MSGRTAGLLRDREQLLASRFALAVDDRKRRLIGTLRGGEQHDDLALERVAQIERHARCSAAARARDPTQRLTLRAAQADRRIGMRCATDIDSSASTFVAARRALRRRASLCASPRAFSHSARWRASRAAFSSGGRASFVHCDSMRAHAASRSHARDADASRARACRAPRSPISRLTASSSCRPSSARDAHGRRRPAGRSSRRRPRRATSARARRRRASDRSSPRRRSLRAEIAALGSPSAVQLVHLSLPSQSPTQSAQPSVGGGAGCRRARPARERQDRAATAACARSAERITRRATRASGSSGGAASASRERHERSVQRAHRRASTPATTSSPSGSA